MSGTPHRRTGRGPLRSLAARFGGSGRTDAGPVVLLRAEGEESAHLSADIDALRHEDPEHATVVVPAGSRHVWRQLTSVLDRFTKSGVTAVRLVWAGAAADRHGRTTAARRIADTWDLDVVAPAGPVVIAPGGTLFAPTGTDGVGGWWRLAPGLGPRPLGLRHPVPGWEDAAALLASDAVDDHVVVSVPAGVQVRRTGPPSAIAPDIGASVPVDQDRLTVVVGAPGTAEVTGRALAALLTRLPPRARSAVRLVPGDGRDLLAVGQETADLLGAEVEVVSGVPALLEAADGTAAPAVVLLDADGEPAWRPYAEAVACLPAGGGRPPVPRLLRPRSPVPGEDVDGDGVLPLDDGWQAAVTRAGLWVGPSGSARPATLGWTLEPDTVVVDVGEPGRKLDDGVWPVLNDFLDRLDPAVTERTTLHVRGACTARGGRRVRRLAERRGLALEYDVEPATTDEEPDARAAAQREGVAEAPWHASPMSVRVRHVATPPVSAPARVPVAPVVASAPTAQGPGAPPAARAPVPPGYDEARAATRASGHPAPVSARAPGAATAGAAAAPTATASATAHAPVSPPRIMPPAPAGRRPDGAVPSPIPSSPDGSADHRPRGSQSPPIPSSRDGSVGSRPGGSQSPPIPPSPDGPVGHPPGGAGAPPVPPSPEPVSVPQAGAAPEVMRPRIGPSYRSGPAEREAMRALAGEQWWRQQAAVARTVTVMPGLRGGDRDEDVSADLVAVRSFLTLDDAPLGWRWLERRLAAGSAEAQPCLAGLASGLRRLPSYRGAVLRAAGTLPSRAPLTGTELCPTVPVCAYALGGAPVPAGDRYLIWSLTGRRVRGLTGAAARGDPEEVVFRPGTRFRVLGTQGGPGATTVLLREVAAGESAARPGEQDAADRQAREHLTQAAAGFSAAENPAPWPPRLTGPLAEPNPSGGGTA